MNPSPTPADWATIDIQPTDDADAVRRAYRARLKSVGPEADPEGFQALRRAYEIILAACGSDRVDTPPNDGIDVADRFLATLSAHRAAGDEAGAIALVDAEVVAHPPGSAALAAIEEALLDRVALSRTLSPGLLLHLAGLFDWRDSQGRASRHDPEHHAVLLDRLAAEDFFLVFRGYAEAPEGRIERLMLAPYDEAVRLMGADGIGPEGRGEVRELFDRVLVHARFLLGRFDGGTLALLREAVEGPPSLGEAQARPSTARADGGAGGAAATSSGSIVDMVSPRTKWIMRLIIFGGLLAFVFGSVFYKRSGSAPYVGTDTALAADVALPMLKNPAVPWVDLIQEPDGVKVDWAPIMRMRHAVAELRVGYNMEKPDTAFPLPEFDAPIGFLAPENIKLIVMRVKYTDGTWSEIRRYPVGRKAN